MLTYAQPSGAVPCPACASCPAYPIIDVLGVSASHAYSLRLLRAAYSGKSIRVRRSSDNTEQDIGFLSGALDTAAMLTFVGAGNGFISKFYDQSGNVRDLTQTTQANQPQIVSSGAVVLLTTGKPGMSTNGTSQMLLGAAVTVNQSFSRSGVVKFTAVASGKDVYSDGVGNSLNFSASGSLATFAGANATFKTGIAAGDLATVLEIVAGASSEGRYNGTAVAINPSTASLLRANLGGAYNGTTATPGNAAVFSEHLIFPSALSAGNRTALEADQRAFWNTP